MSQDELNARLAASPSADRVTPEQITSRIAVVRYARLDGTVTLCTIILDNHYSVRGESACVDPANFDAEIGNKIAYDDAFRKLWPLFGFLLAERRHIERIIASEPAA